MQERNVTEVWEFILPGLQKMEEAGGDRVDDIHQSLLGGYSKLLYGEDGFIVISLEITNDEPYLYIWVGYSFKDAHHEMFRKYEPLFEAIARQNGLKKIQFCTHRHGFARTIDKEWKMVHTLWEKEIV